MTSNYQEYVWRFKRFVQLLFTTACLVSGVGKDCQDVGSGPFFQIDFPTRYIIPSSVWTDCIFNRLCTSPPYMYYLMVINDNLHDGENWFRHFPFRTVKILGRRLENWIQLEQNFHISFFTTVGKFLWLGHSVRKPLSPLTLIPAGEVEVYLNGFDIKLCKVKVDLDEFDIKWWKNDNNKKHKKWLFDVHFNNFR
jgi:hypothetical protein